MTSHFRSPNKKYMYAFEATIPHCIVQYVLMIYILFLIEVMHTRVATM
jgi:hypothetical protein